MFACSLLCLLIILQNSHPMRYSLKNDCRFYNIYLAIKRVKRNVLCCENKLELVKRKTRKSHTWLCYSTKIKVLLTLYLYRPASCSCDIRLTCKHTSGNCKAQVCINTVLPNKVVKSTPRNILLACSKPRNLHKARLTSTTRVLHLRLAKTTCKDACRALCKYCVTNIFISPAFLHRWLIEVYDGLCVTSVYVVVDHMITIFFAISDPKNTFCLYFLR